jgi:hypothetical protein
VIAEVGDSTFTVDCTSVIAGRVDSRVTVRKFRDWTSARIRIPYEKGQQLLLFLDPDVESHGLYWVRGSGDEGEMLLLSGGEFLWRGMRVDGYLVGMHEVHGRAGGRATLVSRGGSSFPDCFPGVL